MAKRQKIYFFQGATGSSYEKFRKENVPSETTYRDLFDSIPFVLDSADAASESYQGLAKKQTDANVRTRTAGSTWAYFVQPQQLPNIVAHDVSEVALAEGTIDNQELIGWGLTVKYLGTTTRRNFGVRLNQNFVSSVDSRLVFSPIAGGMKALMTINLEDLDDFAAIAPVNGTSYVLTRAAGKWGITASAAPVVKYGLIHNDNVEELSTLLSTNQELKAYSLPSDVFVAAGDRMEIEADFNLISNNNTSYCEINLSDGTGNHILITQPDTGGVNNACKVHIKIQVNVINVTTKTLRVFATSTIESNPSETYHSSQVITMVALDAMTVRANVFTGALTYLGNNSSVEKLSVEIKNI